MPAVTWQAKLAELQDLVMRLVGERNEWYTRYISAVGNPHNSATEGSDMEEQPAQKRMELNAVDGPGTHTYILVVLREV